MFNYQLPITNYQLRITNGFPHAFRVQPADLTPEFVALRVEIDEGGGVLEAVHGREFASHIFLDVEADEDQFASEFFFQPVHDGFHFCAENSVGGLKFEQGGLALSDLFPHLLGVFEQGRLDGMQDEPGGDQPGDDDAQPDQFLPARFVAEDEHGRRESQGGGDPYGGVLIEDLSHAVFPLTLK
ncbi:MAG: hypothetical protein D8M55_10790 [Chloroflexi bacterium]|nr:hypothetical protein [Anaerolineae bacterium]MBL1172912.1 hypothetical protein [Chloroflexota bacterium]MDL1924875.1 hypothetical protein [Anaerolineae bacterium AMX1]